MSHDDSAGKICLDPKTNGAFIEWKDVGHQQIFEKIANAVNLLKTSNSDELDKR